MSMTQLLKRILGLIGFGGVNHNDPYYVKKFLTENAYGELIIFDVGAYNGVSALKYNKIFPNSRIYSSNHFRIHLLN